MPISKNLITAGWSGAFAKQIVFRQLAGKTAISAYPRYDSKKRSEKQKLINIRMKEANSYAQTIMADDEERHKAQVRLDVRRNKLYTALISEYFKSFRPVEDQVATQPELPTAIEASTNFVQYLF